MERWILTMVIWLLVVLWASKNLCPDNIAYWNSNKLLARIKHGTFKQKVNMLSADTARDAQSGHEIL